MSFLLRRSVPLKAIKNIFSISTPIRHLNLLEYQSKKLLEESGCTIQKFRVLESPQDSKALDDFNVGEYVVKAQILAGGRGKGHFDNGFKGGVHITKNRGEALKLVQQMIGHKLITKQTPPDGILVQKVMVADSVNIIRETYVCIVMDRESNGPVLVASPAGGMDIEEVAEKTPEKLKKVPIDINRGLSQKTAEEVADFLEFRGALREKAATEILNLYKLFNKVDAVQVEINPLAETDDGRCIFVDAKLAFDDNAKFRQKAIFAMEDHSETDPKEVEASKYDLNYVAMDGNIGCLVNGAGLAMATMDIIKINGGHPANFLDVGGGVKEAQVLKAFEILTSDKNVKAILVNIFGGIVNCATIANGIVNAYKTINLKVPLVVRLEGNEAEKAKHILKKSGLPILAAHNLEEASKMVVDSIQ